MFILRIFYNCSVIVLVDRSHLLCWVTIQLCWFFYLKTFRGFHTQDRLRYFYKTLNSALFSRARGP